MGVLKGARELKKGSAEFLILSLVEVRARHGYDIAQLIEQRSEGTVTFHAASLYPLLYKLEKRGWIEGRWTEKAGERRRRVYKITREGKKVLAERRSGWEAFVRAIPFRRFAKPQLFLKEPQVVFIVFPGGIIVKSHTSPPFAYPTECRISRMI